MRRRRKSAIARRDFPRGIFLQMAREKIEIVDQRFAQRVIEQPRRSFRAESDLLQAARNALRLAGAQPRDEPRHAGFLLQREPACQQRLSKMPGVSAPVPSSSGNAKPPQFFRDTERKRVRLPEKQCPDACRVALQIIERLQDDGADMRGQIGRDAKRQVLTVARVAGLRLFRRRRRGRRRDAVRRLRRPASG